LSLDPDIHFLDPALRIVLEMLSVVYWQIGALDWASVIQALREVNEIEACGGLEGLNEIYTDGGHYPEGRLPQFAEAFVREYIQLLYDYANQRESDPTKPVYRFTGGKGKLRLNKLARCDSDPSDVGEALICGRRYKILGWCDGNELVIKFYPEAR
jgi:hypothetical protein